MDRLVAVKFHINIANRWLFMKQKIIIMGLSFSIHKVMTCLGGRFFQTRCIFNTKLHVQFTLFWHAPLGVCSTKM